MEAFGHLVQLSVLGMDTESVEYFFANPNIHKNRLGRRGWLDRVRFGLDEYQNLVYLAPFEDPV